MERTTSMSFKLVNVRHRHCVFTIDEQLRDFFLNDRSLLDCLFHAVNNVVSRMVFKQRGLSISCIFQNLPQMQNRYPFNQWQEIIGNCDTQLFLQSIGKRKLLTPDEILRLPLDTALIILRGQKVLKVQKYDYTLHPDAKKLVTKKAAEHIPKWREEGKTEEYDYLPKPPSKPRRQRNGSSASSSAPRKPPSVSAPAMPTQVTQKHIYQEPPYPDSSDRSSNKLWSDEPEMVPFDKNSIMS